MTHLTYERDNPLSQAPLPVPGAARRSSHGLLLASLIWVPALSIAGVLYLLDVYYPAAGAVALALVLHACIHPRTAIYGLVFLIHVDWLVGITTGLTVGKAFGLLAAAVSLPRILSALQTGRRDPAAKWIVLFVLLPFVMLIVSSNPLYSLFSSVTLVLIYSLPLLLCVHFVERSHLRLLLIILIFGCLINTGIFFFRGDVTSAVESYRRIEVGSEIGAEVADTTTFPRLNAIAIFACIFLFVTWRSTWVRVLVVLAGLAMVVGVVIMKGRAVYIALPASLVIGVLALKGAGFGRRLALIVMVVLLGAAAFLVGDAIGLWGTGIVDRFTSIFEKGTEAGSRHLIWTGYAKSFLASGLMGNGLQMTRISPAFLECFWKSKAGHNDLIHIAGDLGVVGLTLFIGLHVHLFMRIRRMRLVWHKAFALFTQVFILVCGLSQAQFWNRYYGLSLALILVFARYDERQRRVEPAVPAAAPAAELPGQAWRAPIPVASVESGPSPAGGETDPSGSRPLPGRPR